MTQISASRIHARLQIEQKTFYARSDKASKFAIVKENDGWVGVLEIGYKERPTYWYLEYPREYPFEPPTVKGPMKVALKSVQDWDPRFRVGQIASEIADHLTKLDTQDETIWCDIDARYGDVNLMPSPYTDCTAGLPVKLKRMSCCVDLTERNLGFGVVIRPDRQYVSGLILSGNAFFNDKFQTLKRDGTPTQYRGWLPVHHHDARPGAWKSVMGLLCSVTFTDRFTPYVAMDGLTMLLDGTIERTIKNPNILSVRAMVQLLAWSRMVSTRYNMQDRTFEETAHPRYDVVRDLILSRRTLREDDTIPTPRSQFVQAMQEMLGWVGTGKRFARPSGKIMKALRSSLEINE